MLHDKCNTYHGDIVHYLSVDLYSTEPPEEPILGSFLFVLKGSSLFYLISTTIQLPKKVYF